MFFLDGASDLRPNYCNGSVVNRLDEEVAGLKAHGVAVGVGEADGRGEIECQQVFGAAAFWLGVVELVELDEGVMIAEIAIDQTGQIGQIFSQRDQEDQAVAKAQTSSDIVDVADQHREAPDGRDGVENVVPARSHRFTAGVAHLFADDIGVEREPPHFVGANIDKALERAGDIIGRGVHVAEGVEVEIGRRVAGLILVAVLHVVAEARQVHVEDLLNQRAEAQRTVFLFHRTHHRRTTGEFRDIVDYIEVDVAGEIDRVAVCVGVGDELTQIEGESVLRGFGGVRRGFVAVGMVELVPDAYVIGAEGTGGERDRQHHAAIFAEERHGSADSGQSQSPDVVDILAVRRPGRLHSGEDTFGGPFRDETEGAELVGAAVDNIGPNDLVEEALGAGGAQEDIQRAVGLLLVAA